MDELTLFRHLWWANSTFQTVYVDYSLIPPVALYCLLGVMAVFGLLGNVLARRMTRHFDIQVASYGVHLAFLAIVDSLDLVLTIAESVGNTNIDEKEAFLTSNEALCKMANGFRLWIGDMSALGLFALALDRYVALVLPRFKSLICTVTNAFMTCFINCLISLITSITCSTTYFVVDFPNVQMCVEDNNSVHYFYANSAVTGIVPCAFILYFAVHGCAVHCRRNQSAISQLALGQRATSLESETDGSLLVLSLVCVLSLLPKAIHELLLKYEYIRLVREPHMVEQDLGDFVASVTQLSNVILLVSCVNLSCKVYVLTFISPFFRRCVRETTRNLTTSGTNEPTEDAGDTRDLPTIAEGGRHP